MSSHSAPYIPPEPVLTDEIVVGLLAEADKADSALEKWEGLALLLLKIAGIAATAYNPAVGAGVLATTAALEGYLRDNAMTNDEATQMGNQLRELYELIRRLRDEEKTV